MAHELDPELTIPGWNISLEHPVNAFVYRFLLSIPYRSWDKDLMDGVPTNTMFSTSILLVRCIQG